MTDLVGKWNVFAAEFEPQGPMAPEDLANVKDRFWFDGGKQTWFEFHEDGQMQGQLLTVECDGRWVVDETSLTILEWCDQGELGITPAFTLGKEGVVLRFGWEGGVMQLRLEKPGAGLSGSVKARIREIWDSVVECDRFDPAEIAAILDTVGGAAAQFMHGAESDIWLLGPVITADQFALAQRLVEMGATPNDEALRAAKRRVQHSRHLAKAEALVAFIEARLASS